jgi:hypothetical protein
MATYTYVSVASVTPNHGTAAGGTAVTITGTGFDLATGVTFDGLTATSIVYVSATTITCVTPTHASGAVTVAVLGVDTLADAYTYEVATNLLPPIPFRVPVLQDGQLVEVNSWGRWLSTLKLRVEAPVSLVAEQITGVFQVAQIPQLPWTKIDLDAARRLLGRTTAGAGAAEEIRVLSPLVLNSTGLGFLGAPGGFTQGSVIFAGPIGTLSQDNANFYWDDTKNALGIGVHPFDANHQLAVGGADGTIEGIAVYSAGAGLEFKNFANSIQYGVISSFTTGAGGLLVSTSGNANPLLLNTNGGPTGVGGVTTPTAHLHLAAGIATATFAPLKFTSGVLLGTAEAGAVEFLTDKFYGTITTGAVRKTFAFLESPQFVTPDIGAATGTSLTLSGALSSPSLIAAAAMTITPAAGTNLNVSLSTTGDFAVNTNQLYVDTSAARVGINRATPTQALSISGEMDFYAGTTLRGIIGPSSWASNFFTFQNATLAESASNFALSQDDTGQTYINAASGKLVYFRVNNNTFMAGNVNSLLVIGPNVVAGDFPTGSVGIVFKDGTILSAMATDTAGDYADDVGGTVERFCINEGNEKARLTGLACRNTSQFDKTASTALANVTGLTRNVAAGVTYRFEATLFITADVTGGSKFAIAGTATATSILYDILLLDESTKAFTITSRQTALAGSAGQAGTTSGICRILGTIVVNAAGTLTVQFAQNASNLTSSILANSTFTLQQVP